jgi:hypothetical protein
MYYATLKAHSQMKNVLDKKDIYEGIKKGAEETG